MWKQGRVWSETEILWVLRCGRSESGGAAWRRSLWLKKSQIDSFSAQISLQEIIAGNSVSGKSAIPYIVNGLSV